MPNERYKEIKRWQKELKAPLIDRLQTAYRMLEKSDDYNSVFIRRALSEAIDKLKRWQWKPGRGKRNSE